MTIKEYNAKLAAKIKELESINLPLQLAAASTHESFVERIFQEGKAANGEAIGKYNTTSEMYINPANAVRKGGLKVAGKYGETKFKNGKPHKTAYLKSYSQYRQKVGRQTAYVDLVLSGDLQKDLANNGEPIRITANKYISKVKRDINALKIEGNEDRFGKDIFKLSAKERIEFKEIALKELLRILE